MQQGLDRKFGGQKMIDKKEMIREEIEGLGLNAIKDYFKVNPEELDVGLVKSIHDKAKLAMSFERERNVSKRSVELNYIRVFRLISDDKKELKKYIKKSMPKYLPA